MKKIALKVYTVVAFAAIAFTTLLSGCEYEFVEPEPVVIPTQISFSTDIVPIFNASCNMSGCHSAGAIAPELTAANAYGNLFQLNLINTADPQSSELYKLITTGSMKSFATNAQAQLILAWIEKGALNN